MHRQVQQLVDDGKSFRLITSHGSYYVPSGVELSRCDDTLVGVRGFLWALETYQIINIVED